MTKIKKKCKNTVTLDYDSVLRKSGVAEKREYSPKQSLPAIIPEPHDCGIKLKKKLREKQGAVKPTTRKQNTGRALNWNEDSNAMWTGGKGTGKRSRVNQGNTNMREQ